MSTQVKKEKEEFEYNSVASSVPVIQPPLRKIKVIYCKRPRGELTKMLSPWKEGNGIGSRGKSMRNKVPFLSGPTLVIE